MSILATLVDEILGRRIKTAHARVAEQVDARDLKSRSCHVFSISCDERSTKGQQAAQTRLPNSCSPGSAMARIRLIGALLLVTIQLAFQRRRTLEGHDPPLDRHQICAFMRVSATACTFVVHTELLEAGDQDILAPLEGLLDDLEDGLNRLGTVVRVMSE
jgi:hypothetical protein